MTNKDFYIQLGRLLYAVAMADGVVQDEELQALYKLVVHDIKDDELFGKKDEVDSFYTEFEFEGLLSKNADRHEALQSFHNFLIEEHASFTKKMKQSTIDAVSKIATAFEGVVPEEQEIITQLVLKVKELES